MNKKYGVVQILASALVFFLVLAVVGGHSFAETKKETGGHGEWIEIFIDKAYLFTWCGKRQLILEGSEKKTRLADIHTKDMHELPIAGNYGCSPDGRYVFSLHKTKDCNGLVVYDTKTKQLQCLLQKKEDSQVSFSYRSPTLLSPDGKYFAWYSKGEIKLSGGEILTLIPAFENVENIMIISKEPDPEKRGVQTIAWSPDSKKLFLLTGTSHLDDLRGIPKQYLIMYDVLTNKRTTLQVKFKNEHYGKIIKVSPDGKKLYIKAILGEAVENYLYVLDLTKTGPDKSTVKPILIRKDVWSFDISSDNLIIFHTYPDPETPHKANIKDAGLYLADSEGKIIQRLTSNTIDLYPKFSRDGKAIAFRRTTVKPWTNSIYVLLKK